MLVTAEEILIAWNTATQEDLKEVVKLYSLIKEMKEYGHGSIDIVIQDKKIVFVNATKKWKNQGGSFADCELTI